MSRLSKIIKTVLLLGIITLFTLSLCACASNNPTEQAKPSTETQIPVGTQETSPIIREKTELPDEYYTITAKLCETLSFDERASKVQELSGIFGCTPLIDEGIYYEEVDRIQYPTQEGGIIEYNGPSILYADPDITPCSVLEKSKELTRVAVFDLDAGDDINLSYSVGGSDYSVANAVTFVESLWENSLQSYTSGVDSTRVGSIIVYEDHEGNCTYVLLLDKYIQGLPIEQYSAITHLQEVGFRESFILVEMNEPDHICFYQDFNPFQVVSEEVVDAILSAEDAVERANEVLANYMVYTIQEQALKYGFLVEEEMTMSGYEGTFTGQPYWCMVLEWGNTGGYVPDNYRPNVTLYIDAITGTAYLSDTLYGERLQISE